MLNPKENTLEELQNFRYNIYSRVGDSGVMSSGQMWLDLLPLDGLKQHF